MTSTELGTTKTSFQMRAIPVAALPLGCRIGSTIYGTNNTKLLAAGVIITEQLLAGLKQRHIASVQVTTDEAVRLTAFAPHGTARTVAANREGMVVPLINPVSENIDNNLGTMLGVQAERTGTEFQVGIQKPIAETLDSDLKQHLVEQHEEQVQQLDQLHNDVQRGGSENVHALPEAIDLVLAAVREDVDAFVSLGANPAGDNYPGRHSLHAAMLAVAVGSTLGLDEDQLRSLGIGCLVHDIGMQDTDPKIVKAKRLLPPNEFCEIARHPIRTFDLIEANLDALPAAARIVAYQMHERFDGTGYPRRRQGAQIHKLARIAAVADAYSALVAPRPHRPAMLPYHAITKLLKEAAQGCYDVAVIRGLLKTVSLFPLGSLVELSNGMVGRVTRTTGDTYDRPVVEAWTKGKRTAQGTLFNLAEEAELRIARTVESLE